MLTKARAYGQIPGGKPHALRARCATELVAGWRFLTSMRLALAILLALAFLTALGTIIQQAPTAADGGAAHTYWMAQAQERFGPATALMDRLSLFDVYHSVAFKSLLVFLAASLAACTATRWRSIWNVAFHAPIRPGEGFFVHGHHRAALEVEMTPEAAADVVVRQFAAMGYRVKTERIGQEVALRADRHRLSRFGTFATHLGLLIVLGGAMVGGIWGAQIPSLIVPEGTAVPLGMNTQLSLRLDRFTDEYTPSGVPSDLWSDVTIFDGGREVGNHAIRVNSPLRYNGVAVHQSFTGQSAVLRIVAGNGAELFSGDVPLAWHQPGSDRPLGSLSLPSEGLELSVAGSAGSNAADVVPAGELRLEVYRAGSLVAEPQNLVQGVPMEVNGITFTFVREGRFVGFKVVKDPGLMVVFGGAALLILGMFAVYYFPPRRLWASCVRGSDGRTEVRVAGASQRDSGLDREFDRIREKIESALSEHSVNRVAGERGNCI